MIKKLYIHIVLVFVLAMGAVAQTDYVRTKNFTTREGLPSNVVNSIIQDRQGYLWLGTNQGLTRFDGYRFVNFYVENDGQRQMEGISHIVEDTLYNVLLMSGRDYKLLCFDLARMEFVSAEGMVYPKSYHSEAAETEYRAKANKLGINRGNITNRRHDMQYIQLTDGREIYTTIDNGFYIYDSISAKLNHYCSADENAVIESDYINDVCLDRSGSIWLATTFAGIYQINIDKGNLRYHTLPNSSGNIRSFSKLSDNTIAVGDMDGNVFSYNLHTGKCKQIFHTGSRAYALCTDSLGRFWIGTRGAGVWVDERHLNATDDFVARQIFDICFASDGIVWIGTLDKGLIEVHETQQKEENSTTGQFSYRYYLPEEKIHQLLIDRYDRLWIATENGLFRKDDNEFIHIYNKGKVFSLAAGNSDTLYAGSNGYGLLVIADDRIEHLTTSEGLANNCVEAVAVDQKGRVIAATDQGISIVNAQSNTVHNVYSPLGLMADTYNENAIVTTSDGRIFLGSQRGLVELENMQAVSPNRCCNEPGISCIFVNDVPRYGNSFKTLRLPHDQNNLRFEFSSFAYKESNSILYNYWLEGIDSDWYYSMKEPFALYSNLTPGNYRFHIRYNLSGSEWSEENVYNIVIAQPWYWTWWSRIVYLLLIILFIWYEWHQYQQRLSLRRQLDRRLTSLYAIEVQQVRPVQDSKKCISAIGQENVIKDIVDETPPSCSAAVNTNEKIADQKNKEFLDKLDRLILANLLQTDLDVNFIAKELCVSYSTLHRRVKLLTGLTTNEYIRKHRLAKAMQLLRDGHNATYVAIQCGFNSHSYFTRCFKSEYGILPSEI